MPLTCRLPRADEICDQLLATFARPEYHMQSLFDRFNIEILSTTDAPESDLTAHADLRDETWVSS